MQCVYLFFSQIMCYFLAKTWFSVTELSAVGDGYEDHLMRKWDKYTHHGIMKENVR